MIGVTDDELRREIHDIAKARRVEEQMLTSPYEDPQEFGRRVAVELFEKYVKGSDDRESSSSEAD